MESSPFPVQPALSKQSRQTENRTSRRWRRRGSRLIKFKLYTGAPFLLRSLRNEEGIPTARLHRSRNTDRDLLLLQNPFQHARRRHGRDAHSGMWRDAQYNHPSHLSCPETFVPEQLQTRLLFLTRLHFQCRILGDGLLGLRR